MGWILKKAKHARFGIIFVTLIGVLTSLLGVAFALISKEVLDIATQQKEGSLMVAGVVLGGALVLQLALEMVLSVANIHVSGKFLIRLKTELFEKILKKDYMKISEYHTGELLNRINSDISVVAGGIIDILPNLVFYVTKILACFFALYVLDPVFSILCLLLGPLIFLTAILYRKKMKQLHKDCQAADGSVKSYMQETLKNLLVIKSFGNGGAAAEKSKQLQFHQFKLSLKRNRISICANVFFYIGLTAGYYFALAWGAYKISKGIMTFGTLTALLQLVGQIQTPFQEISSIFPKYFQMLASAERISELETLPEDPVSRRDNWDGEAFSSVELCDAEFGYDEKLILDHVNFSVKQGEFVVISGASGRGKSTLLKVLLGILPMSSGRGELVLSDGKSRPLFSETKQLFSYVPQGNMIVSGTIRENILFFRRDVDEEKIKEACKTAQLWDYISTLPQGLDTVLGEGGLGLSEGQIQRLAIARGVLSDAPILLLDEATSALDEETELAILKALKASKDKTCILVSHKKAAFDFCNRALRFEDNRLVDI